jgi:hypothetical protein
MPLGSRGGSQKELISWRRSEAHRSPDSQFQTEFRAMVTLTWGHRAGRHAERALTRWTLTAPVDFPSRWSGGCCSCLAGLHPVPWDSQLRGRVLIVDDGGDPDAPSRRSEPGIGGRGFLHLRAVSTLPQPFQQPAPITMWPPPMPTSSILGGRRDRLLLNEPQCLTKLMSCLYNGPAVRTTADPRSPRIVV